MGVSKEERRRLAKLRVECAMAYISDPTMPTLADIANDPKYNGITLRTVERWSTVDRWVDRRQEFVRQWMDEAKSRLGTRLAQEKLGELDELNEVREMAMEKLRDGLTVPKSWEGVAKVLLELGRRQEELRQAIGDEVIGAGGRPSLSSATSEMSDEQLLELSKEYLRLKNEQARAVPAQIPADVRVAEVVSSDHDETD